MNDSSLDKRRYALVFLVIGTSTQLIQIIYLREFLTVFYGTELAISIIFGAWLFWTALGSGLTSAIIKKIAISRSLFIGVLITLTVIAPLGVWLIRDLRSYFEVASGDYIQVSNLIISSFLIFAPLCLLIGALFTLATSISGSSRQVYMFESLGCALGGLISIFIVGLINTFSLVVFSAFMLFVSAFLLQNRLVLVFLLVAFLAAIFAGNFEDVSLKRFWRNFNKNFNLLETHNSKYGSISVVEYEGQYNIYQSGHLLFSAPDRGEMKAVTHLIMSQHERPQEVLLVGGGIAGMLKDILMYPVLRVDYLELDPVILDVARRYISQDDLKALGDKRVKVHHKDGRLFVQRTDHKYDIIIINAPDPTTAFSNRFYTLEFFKEVQSHLRPSGIFSLGAVTSHYHYQNPEIVQRNRSIYFTLSRIFNHILVTPGSASYFLASDSNGILSLEEGKVLARLNSYGFKDVNIYSLTEQFYVEKINFELRTGMDYNPLEVTPDETIKPAILNQDNKPVTYYFSLIVWSNLTNDPFTSIIKLISRIRFEYLIIPALILLLIFFVIKRRYFSIATSIFIAGLYGMTLEVLILFLFQSIFGYVYHYVGLLISLFMIGLAIGAWLQKDPQNAYRRLLAIHVAFLILLGVFYLLANMSISASISFIIFLLLMVVNGLLVGSLYPLAVAIISANKSTVETAQHAGFLYSGDIAGGLSGALIVSCFLFPLLGLAVVAGFLFILCLCSFIMNLLVFSRWA